jgi:hypothetical protein
MIDMFATQRRPEYRHFRAPLQTSSRISRLGSNVCISQLEIQTRRIGSTHRENHDHFCRSIHNDRKVEPDLEAYKGFVDDNVLDLDRWDERRSWWHEKVRGTC